MGFLIQLCQHSRDTTDLFLPQNSKLFSDISVTELICFLTLNESKAKPNKYGWLHAFLIRGKTTELKGFMRFLGAVARQFSIGMVCYTGIAINYGYFIALTLEESSGALGTLGIGLKQLSPASASNNTV